MRPKKVPIGHQLSAQFFQTTGAFQHHSRHHPVLENEQLGFVVLERYVAVKKLEQLLVEIHRRFVVLEFFQLDGFLALRCFNRHSCRIDFFSFRNLTEDFLEIHILDLRLVEQE